MTRRCPALLPLAVLLPLALAACKGGEKPAEQSTAGGEILPGSVSDAMVRYDQTRSLPPLAPKATAAAGKDADASEETDDAAADAGPGDPPTAEADGNAEVRPAAE